MTQEIKEEVIPNGEKEGKEGKEVLIPRIIGELFCDEAGVSETDDGLLWAPALPVGELKLSPGPGGVVTKRPLRVIEGHSNDAAEAIGLADVMDAFNEGAVQHVTIPLSHADKVNENTGYIRKLKIDDLEDAKTGTKRKALWAGFDVLDPDIKARMKDGRIANRSVGIEFDYPRKDDGKVFKAALRHIALTNKPWFPGMPNFAGLGLSENDQVISLISADSNWSNNRGLRWREQRLEKALSNLGDYAVSDLDGEEVIIADDKGKHFVASYSIQNGAASIVEPVLWRTTSWEGESSVSDDGGDKPKPTPTDNPDEATGIRPKEAPEGSPRAAPEVKPDPNIDPADTALAEAQSERMLFMSDSNVYRIVSSEGGVKVPEVQEIKLSEDDIVKMVAENERLKTELAERAEAERVSKHTATVDGKINTLKELGLAEQTGFLKVIRDLYLADNEKPAAAMLSEDGKKQSLTVSEILDRVIEALPRDKDQKIALSEQHLAENDGGRPPVDVKEAELTPQQRADKVREEFGFQSKLIVKAS